jgi:hypothetical protein
MAYDVSGNRGVELGLAGGTSLMLGSQRADELADAIDRGRRRGRRRHLRPLRVAGRGDEPTPPPVQRPDAPLVRSFAT